MEMPRHDFAFIDGDHSYEGVQTDLALYSSTIEWGGLICGDDYAGAGDRFEGWGVQRAVDEFVQGTGYALHVGSMHVWWIWKTRNEH
jgi:hypothetical protein